jgi:hypothetical protein
VNGVEPVGRSQAVEHTSVTEVAVDESAAEKGDMALATQTRFPIFQRSLDVVFW